MRLKLIGLFAFATAALAAGCDTIAETLVAPKLVGEWTGTALCGDKGVVTTRAVFGEVRGGLVQVNLGPGPGAAGLLPTYDGAARFDPISYRVGIKYDGKWVLDESAKVWTWSEGLEVEGAMSADFTTISGPKFIGDCTTFELKRP